jgi:hypothetical protein
VVPVWNHYLHVSPWGYHSIVGMTSLKCKQCGLVNPFNVAACKRCGAALVTADSPATATDTDQEAGEKKYELVGVWGCAQAFIMLSIAGSVTGYLGVYIMDYLPSGPYPVVFLIAIFIPAAIVGIAAGGGVLYGIHLLIKAVKGGART